jgi:hypothetical protein
LRNIKEVQMQCVDDAYTPLAQYEQTTDEPRVYRLQPTDEPRVCGLQPTDGFWLLSCTGNKGASGL